jgi:hypothetical protein
MRTTLRAAGHLVAFLACMALAVFAHAEGRPKRFSIWEIHLGDAVTAIPDEYVNYACGTNGGPPSTPLPNFAAFKKCKPDADGLYEVYFEYDDELEYQARALDIKPEIKMYAGTTVFEFPIVASVLFDGSGRVRGERMVTDPRQQVSRDRLEFWELANFVRQRFGEEHWDCKDLPADDGETPTASRFIKSHCEKTAAGVRLVLEQRLYQKKGMQFIDPNTGAAQPQAIESSTRFEMYDTSGNSGAK